MSFPPRYAYRYCYHFTDIRNIESIIEKGLLCTNIKNERKITHRNVASESIQGRRSTMAVTCGNGGVVHDYVPFYFATTNPMYLKLCLSKNIDQQYFVFLALKIDKVIGKGAVFTDGAANGNIPPNFFVDPSELDKLDWGAIDKKQWKSDDNEKQRRMAEVLVYNSVSIDMIDAIIVWNKDTKKILEEIFAKSNVTSPSIVYDHNGRHFHITKFPQPKDRAGMPITTGPETLRRYYKKAIEHVKKQRQIPLASYRFKDIKDALAQLELQFDIIPELGGIYQMKTDNHFHKVTVSDHTIQVVENLKSTAYYGKANSEIRDIMILAAYLHDIGKGPKTRWEHQIQPSYDDHPADGPKMLERILVEDFQVLSDSAIEKICLLVTYHDLIGEVIGKGRDIQQIKDLISNIEDFNMLRALNYADVKAINADWTDNFKVEVTDIKDEIKEYLEDHD